MRLGIVIYSNDAETVWNALRFANFSLKEGDSVKIFLLAKGVEYQKLDSEKFNIQEQTKSFLEKTGEIFACGTCLKSRESEGSEVCPMSTMKDLYELVKESDKVLSF
ncbi:MAG: DsrE family protein [Candidatus Peregrinibacteria bacterium]|nr:DsrE family protein [Candidatus Peregrinibacteria bacterium]